MLQNQEKFLNLFPTPIYKNYYKKKLTNKQNQYIENLKLIKNEGNLTSDNKQILDNKIFKNLKKFIENSLKNYLDSIYNPKKNIELYITQSWINCSRPGEFHHKHQHPNSIVSGVYYINANPNIDKIYFYKDNILNFPKIEPKEWNMYNSDSWWLPVETGNLLLFPSTLKHMVPLVEKDQDRDVRVSLSFNTFIRGEIGEREELTLINL